MAKIADLTVDTINFDPQAVTGVASDDSVVVADNELNGPVEIYWEADLGYRGNASGSALTTTLIVTRTRGSKLIGSVSKSWSGSTSGGTLWHSVDGGVYDSDAQAGDEYTITFDHVITQPPNTFAYEDNVVLRAVWSKK